MEPITVKTPRGVGVVWGIDRGLIICEMDSMYIVGFKPDEVKRVELEEYRKRKEDEKNA